MQADITFVSEKLGEVFNLNADEVVMEIVTLQNDIILKAQQGSLLNFWGLVERCAHHSFESCVSVWFNESAFSDMNFIKNKQKTCISDAHLGDTIRVAVPSYTPEYSALVDAM